MGSACVLIYLTEKILAVNQLQPPPSKAGKAKVAVEEFLLLVLGDSRDDFSRIQP
jgi:hypothetical protein